MTKVEKVAEVFFYSIEIWKKKNANGNDVIKRKKNGKERGYCLSDVLKQVFKTSGEREARMHLGKSMDSSSKL